MAQEEPAAAAPDGGSVPAGPPELPTESVAPGQLAVGDRAIAACAGPNGTEMYEVEVVQVGEAAPPARGRKGRAGSASPAKGDYLVRYVKWARRGEDWVHSAVLYPHSEELAANATSRAPRKNMWGEARAAEEEEEAKGEARGAKAKVEADEGRDARRSGRRGSGVDAGGAAAAVDAVVEAAEAFGRGARGRKPPRDPKAESKAAKEEKAAKAKASDARAAAAAALASVVGGGEDDEEAGALMRGLMSGKGKGWGSEGDAMEVDDEGEEMDEDEMEGEEEEGESGEEGMLGEEEGEMGEEESEGSDDEMGDESESDELDGPPEGSAKKSSRAASSPRKVLGLPDEGEESAAEGSAAGEGAEAAALTHRRKGVPVKSVGSIRARTYDQTLALWRRTAETRAKAQQAAAQAAQQQAAAQQAGEGANGEGADQSKGTTTVVSTVDSAGATSTVNGHRRPRKMACPVKSYAM